MNQGWSPTMVFGFLKLSIEWIDKPTVSTKTLVIDPETGKLDVVVKDDVIV